MGLSDVIAECGDEFLVVSGRDELVTPAADGTHRRSLQPLSLELVPAALELGNLAGVGLSPHVRRLRESKVRVVYLVFGQRPMGRNDAALFELDDAPLVVCAVAP